MVRVIAKPGHVSHPQRRGGGPECRPTKPKVHTLQRRVNYRRRRLLAVVKVRGVEQPGQHAFADGGGFLPGPDDHHVFEAAHCLHAELARVKEVLQHLELIGHVAAKHHRVRLHRRPVVVGGCQRKRHTPLPIQRRELEVPHGFRVLVRVVDRPCGHAPKAPSVRSNRRHLQVVPVIHVCPTWAPGANHHHQVGGALPGQLVLDGKLARAVLAQHLIERRQIGVDQRHLRPRQRRISGKVRLHAPTVLGRCQSNAELVGVALHQARICQVVAGVEGFGSPAVERPAARQVVGHVCVEIPGVAHPHNRPRAAPSLKLVFLLWKALSGRHAPELIQDRQQLRVILALNKGPKRRSCRSRNHRQRHGKHTARAHLKKPRVAVRIETDPMTAREPVVVVDPALPVRGAGIGRQAPCLGAFLQRGCQPRRYRHLRPLDGVVRQRCQVLSAISGNNLHHAGHGPAPPRRPQPLELGVHVLRANGGCEIGKPTRVLDPKTLQRHVLGRKGGGRVGRVPGNAPPGLLGQSNHNPLALLHARHRDGA